MADYKDSNDYVWSVPDDQFDTQTDPAQLDAGQAITVTAPSGESTSWGVNEVFQVTDPNDLSTALAAVSNAQGTYGYPTTAEEQKFIDNCNAIIDKLNDMINTASSVGAEAEAIEAWVQRAAEVAVGLAWIPLIGGAIAAIGGAILGADLAAEKCTDSLMQVIGQAANADLQLQDLRDKVTNHGDKNANIQMLLSDAETQLNNLSSNAMSFWELLESTVKACV